MVKIAGCWELGWNTPIKEFDLWQFVIDDFAVDELIMTPISGIDETITEYKTIQEAIDNNKNLFPVFVDEEGGTNLQDFIHPENVLYIPGRAGFSPMIHLKGETSIRIKTPKQKGVLWPHQVMAIVLYDRMIKCQ